MADMHVKSRRLAFLQELPDIRWPAKMSNPNLALKRVRQ